MRDERKRGDAEFVRRQRELDVLRRQRRYSVSSTFLFLISRSDHVKPGLFSHGQRGVYDVYLR